MGTMYTFVIRGYEVQEETDDFLEFICIAHECYL